MAGMTSTSFRVRLAIALGLPLAACGSSGPAPVTPTTGSGTPAGSATSAPPPGHAAPCGADEVLESVCGRIDADHTKKRIGAPPPHDRCPADARDLEQLEDNGVMDGWRKDAGDPIYGNMTYSQKRSVENVNTSGVAEGEPRCCYERCTALPAITKARDKVPAGMHEYEECWPKPVSASHPAPGGSGCPVAMHVRIWYPDGAEDPLDDAPFARGDENSCCYNVASLHECPPNTFKTARGCEQPNPGGRALRADGVAVVAPVRARDGWTGAAETAEELSPAARAFAASAWAREAGFEHASVAAFARLSIELMAHGAPAELVDAAHAAARDEIRHAQRGYAVASAYGGAQVGPGPLPLATVGVASLEELAVDCFRDGCVGETVAALCVAEAGRRAPAHAAMLAAIADDEARHAELSYRVLAWALGIGGAALRARIAAELEAVRAEVVAAGDPHADHDERCGVLHPRTAADVRRRVIADVVVPCTTALLAQTRATAS